MIVDSIVELPIMLIETELGFPEPPIAMKIN